MFMQEDFVKWNKTTSVFHLPKRLVGKSKISQLPAELVKTKGESKVCAVQALPVLKFYVCFSFPSFCRQYDINSLNFWMLTITPFPAYEEVRAVFVNHFASSGARSISFLHLGTIWLCYLFIIIHGFPSVESATCMVSMVIGKAIPAAIRVTRCELSFRYPDSLLLPLHARRWGTLQRTVKNHRNIAQKAV